MAPALLKSEVGAALELRRLISVVENIAARGQRRELIRTLALLHAALDELELAQAPRIEQPPELAAHG